MSGDSSRRHFLTGVAGTAAFAASSASAAAAITQRTLGKTGIKVTPLALGGTLSDASIVTRAYDLGINYFDTARIYMQGNSERMLGVGLKGIRDKVTLVSKTASRNGKDCLADLETSLKELGTDHLDVWYLHARDTAEAISEDCVAAQETAKKQGKVRFVGVSTHDPNAVADHILKLGKHDVVFLTYSFSMGTSRDAAIAKLKNAGLGLLAMKVTTPAGGGGYEMPGRGGRSGGRGAAAPPVARKPGAALAGVKWVLRNPAIAAAIVTMMDSDALTENIRAVTEKMTPDEEKLLVAVNEDIRPYYCRMCYKCDGQCPQGMPVTDVLRYLAYSDFCGDFPKGRQNFAELPAQVQQIRCGECSGCSVDCPNGVRVRDRLIRAQEMFA